MSCGSVYEHRLVMEEHLGRYLEPHEQVHHRDENKRNNHIDNLLLCSSQQEHSEQHSYDPAYLIHMLIRFADVHGRLPTKKECDREPQMPHSSTYIRRFESWSAAKSLAQTQVDIWNDNDSLFEYY